MKILDTTVVTYPTPVLGRICDRCGHRVQQHRYMSDTNERSVVSIGAELAKFITIDLDQGGMLYRADLCPTCGGMVFDLLRPMMAHMRRITEPNERGVRTFHYQAVDAVDGQRFSVSSIIDDGA